MVKLQTAADSAVPNSYLHHPACWIPYLNQLSMLQEYD